MALQRIDASPKSGQIAIVHLGLGAFHRAHQAVYLERYRQRSGDVEWGVCSANLRSSIGLVDGLRDADYRYQVAEYADSDTLTLREIGVIEETLFSGRDNADKKVWIAGAETERRCWREWPLPIRVL